MCRFHQPHGLGAEPKAQRGADEFGQALAAEEAAVAGLLDAGDEPFFVTNDDH